MGKGKLSESQHKGLLFFKLFLAMSTCGNNTRLSIAELVEDAQNNIAAIVTSTQEDKKTEEDVSFLSSSVLFEHKYCMIFTRM